MIIAVAVICTLIAGGVGAFLEPVSLSVALPIAVMGGFILKVMEENRKENHKEDNDKL